MNNSTTLAVKMGYLLQRYTLAKIAEIVLIFATALGLLMLLLPLAQENPLNKQLLTWCVNLYMMALVGLGLRLRGEGLGHFGLALRLPTLRSLFKIIGLSFLVFVLALIGFMVGSMLMVNIHGMPAEADFSSYQYLQGKPGKLLISLLGIYLVSSFGEEFIYRGFLINRIAQLGASSRWATTIAVLTSSVIFGLIHYSWGPMGIVQTGFMGLVLGFCYLKLKNLWILVLAHAYLDTLLMLQLYLASNP